MNRARRDLCGGRSVMGVPTAMISVSYSGQEICRFSVTPRRVLLSDVRELGVMLIS